MEIGDVVFVADFYNDKVIAVGVEGFITDKHGTFPAEHTWDGWEKIGFHYGDKYFGSRRAAAEWLEEQKKLSDIPVTP